MSNLFNNKYYNQLFGGKREEEDMRSEDTRGRLERIFGGEGNANSANSANSAAPSDESSEETLTTEDRLDEILGGRRGVKGTRKPKPAKKTDAELLQKFGDGGRTTDGRQIFVFKNGAEAVRDDNGRFVIITGAPEALAAYRASQPDGRIPRKVHPTVSEAQAKRAWTAYWNQKKVQAARYNRVHGLVAKKYTTTPSGKRVLKRSRGSRVLAVKRAMSRSLKFQKRTGLLLDETSPQGYLYLQKEKILRDRSGQPLVRRRDGKVSVRRAGVARHSFRGVAPVVPGTFMKSKGPSARALAGIQEWRNRPKVSQGPRRAKHPGVVSAREVSAAERIAARNATLRSKQGARAGERLPAAPRARRAPKAAMAELA